MIGSEEVHENLRKTFGAQAFRSGFLKLSILRILSERPLHGYALMKEIERITDSSWKPSPGSIYPALQSLRKNSLIDISNEGRQRTYDITPQGKAVLDYAMERARAGLHNVQNLLEYLSLIHI